MVSIFFSEEWLAYLEEVSSWGSRGASFARAEKTRRLTFPFSSRIRRAGAAGQAREISDLFVYFYKAEEGWAGETSECIER